MPPQNCSLSEKSEKEQLTVEFSVEYRSYECAVVNLLFDSFRKPWCKDVVILRTSCDLWSICQWFLM